MSAPWQPAQEARGLLLVSGGTGPVSTWVRRGQVACQVVELGAWTAVLPTERSSRAEPPYDDAVTLLAARPVPRRLRSALGFFTIDGRAVVTVQGPGWRSALRWLVWEPGVGLVRTPGLELARPSDLLAAAGRPGDARAVAEVVGGRDGRADGILTDLLAALALPGADLVGPGVGLRGQVVAPTAQAVARFDARMAEQARHRTELEENS
ncbi:hypothetical protein SAMN04489867_1365 [Pedococcus dokdonensis]|uniref:Uncharacterized protein n=1 Tax=Pedococcus dokdonensis TaxID=443156 RepID=A0A1H0PTS3_9MICO|nr:hypothetical protein [Pedococcus dokdonensis]SDP08065.1 hypothetical protein SAMN04489867_1365 [Pedococcus dokdonensis]